MAEYNFFTVVDASHDDDTIYPTLSAPDARYPVELTAEDGTPSYFQASKALVQQATTKGGLASVMQLPTDIKWECLVTDSRLIIYCTKYDKGGGWSGFGAGAFVALAANAVSKARAAHRRKGKVLVGQIRYGWIASVGGSPKEGWRSAENLRLMVDSNPGGSSERNIYLTLVLPKQLDAASIAHEVATRCGKYRLSNDVIEGAPKREEFEAFAKQPKKTPAASKPGNPAWAWYYPPNSYRVNSKTARPQPKVETPEVDSAAATSADSESVES